MDSDDSDVHFHGSQLRYISRCIANEWKILGHILGLEDWLWSHEYGKRDNSKEQCRLMLLHWQELGRCKSEMLEALAKMKRTDVVSCMSWFPDYATRGIPKTFIRNDECLQIEAFADFQHCKTRMLIVYGLPGSGKTYLVDESLRRIQKSSVEVDIIKPFVPVFSSDIVKLELLLDILRVAGSQQSSQSFSFHGQVLDFERNSIIILDMVNFKFDHTNKFLVEVYDALEYGHCKVKVVALCLILPNFVQDTMCLVGSIPLQELSLRSSVELFQLLCPAVHSSYLRWIAKYTGGLPAVIETVSSHISSSMGNLCCEERDDAFLGFYNLRTVNCSLLAWFDGSKVKNGIKRIISFLGEEELQVLVIFLSTSGSFKTADLYRLFCRPVNNFAERFSSQYCILQHIGNVFVFNPVIRSFLRDEIRTQTTFCRLLNQAESVFVSYYLDLVLQCGSYVFGSKNFLPCLQDHLADLRINCCHCSTKFSFLCDKLPTLNPSLDKDTFWLRIPGSATENTSENACSCSDFKLICQLFHYYERDILYAFRQSLYLNVNYQQRMMGILVYTAPLLRKVLKLKDLFSILQELLVITEKCELPHALVESTLIYLHLLCYGSCSKSIDVQIHSLKNTSAIFDKYQASLNNVYLEGWARVNLNLGSLIVTAYGDYDYGLCMMQKGLQIRKNLSSSDLLVVGALVEMSLIHLKELNVSMAFQYIQDAINVFRKFGAHPFAAESYHQLGNIYMMQGKLKEALIQYSHAVKLDKMFFQNHVETIRSLSSLGIAYSRIGQKQTGYRYLYGAFSIGQGLEVGCTCQSSDANGAIKEELRKACDDWIVEHSEEDTKWDAPKISTVDVARKAAVIRSALRHARQRRVPTRQFYSFQDSFAADESYLDKHRKQFTWLVMVLYVALATYVLAVCQKFC